MYMSLYNNNLYYPLGLCISHYVSLFPEKGCVGSSNLKKKKHARTIILTNTHVHLLYNYTHYSTLFGDTGYNHEEQCPHRAC